jgi:hypothetical protein
MDILLAVPDFARASKDNPRHRLLVRMSQSAAQLMSHEWATTANNNEWLNGRALSEGHRDCLTDGERD